MSEWVRKPFYRKPFGMLLIGMGLLFACFVGGRLLDTLT